MFWHVINLVFELVKTSEITGTEVFAATQIQIRTNMNRIVLADPAALNFVYRA